MRSKVTFLLLALNLLLFGYLIVSERPWSATKEIEANRRRVLGPEAADLSAIEITAYDPAPAGAAAEAPAPASSAPSRSVRLQRNAKNDTWVLAAPLDWPANDFAVRRILGELQFLEHETSFPVSDLEANGQTLADYGLAQPRLVVTCTPAPAKPTDGSAPPPSATAPFVLRIGDGTAVGNRLYVLSPDGRRIHVVARTLLEALSLDLAQLRSDQLFTIPVFEARALTLQSGANSARTRLRRDQNRWIFESPINARAAKTPVELAINDLNALQVARFLPADAPASAEATGLAVPGLRITLEGNARRETLHLGRPVSDTHPAADAAVEYYARLDDRPTLFTVALPASLRKTLDGAQTALRDRRVLDFDPAHATDLVLGSPVLPPLRIQKLDTPDASAPAEWQLASSALPVPLRADPALVARLLRNLRLLEAVPPAPAPGRPEPSPFFSDAPSGAELENLGFNRPERVITLRLDPPAAPGAPVAGATTVVLELALPGGTDPGVYARVVGQPFIYVLPPDSLDLFPVVPAAWRDRGLARLPETTKITRLVLRKASDPAAAPILDYTPSDAPPPPAVATLLAAMRDLRANRIVREDYPAAMPVDGVEKPWAYVLEATTEPPSDGPVTITLAERSGGMTQLAGSEKLNLVFTLDQAVLDALWTLLYPTPAKPAAP